MTCCVGLERDGVVYLAGDSCASNEHFDKNVRRDEKVFLNGPTAMGFSDSWRAGQLLRYALTVPEQHPNDVDMKFLVVDFVDAVRDCFKDKGILKKDDEVEEVSSTFLLGYRKKLYYVDEDFQIAQCAESYAAVGCGQAYAMGVMHYLTTHHPQMEPKIVLERALDAAVAHSAGVSKPYNFVQLGEPNKRTKKSR